MKRLLDESTDELTRSLLGAGIEHRPPPGNKAQVIMAIGAGSAFGLFSSNAFAWLGTTAGKVTAAGVAVGVAGAVFVAGPAFVASPRNTDVSAASASNTAARSTASPRVEALDVDAELAVVSPAASPGSGAVSPDAELPGQASGETLAGSGGEPSAEGLASASRSRVTASGERKKAASTKTKSSRRLSSRKPGQRRSGGAVPVLAEGDALAAAGLPSPAVSAEVLAAEGTAAEGAPAGSSALDTEVRLVDDMHWAARRNDRVALGRFVEAYRETFPDGQLKKEVAEFAARLERSDAP
jgi:hypothetical protein